MIEDAPALAIRGVMLDVSRGKIPTLEPLYRVADALALCKLNHLELYLEGFSFAYPGFEDYWAEGDPLTGEDIRALDGYCRERFIDLVPNQNSLGHMGPWLAKPELAPLAETPGGFSVHGMTIPPTTLDPADPGSLVLVGRMAAGLLPNFTSDWFHVGLDEPFELGRGKSRERAERDGVESVYLDYVEKLAAQVEGFGKRMLMWGDILGRHPGAERRLPAGVTVMEWGYEAEHPYEKRCAALEAAGVPFLVCPGTGSWSTFGGLTDNMLANTRAAARAAKAHGGLGLVTTDWGDGGHVQYLPVSWAGIAAAAALAWGEELPEPELAGWLDRFVYRDKAGVTGNFSLALGRYARFEECALPCRALAAMSVDEGLVSRDAWETALRQSVAILAAFVPPEVLEVYTANYERRGPMDYAGLTEYLDGLEAALAQSRMEAPDGPLVRREYQNAIRMIRLGEGLRRVVTAGEPPAAQAKAVRELLGLARDILPEHEAVWLARNRAAGLSITMEAFRRLEAQLAQRLAELETTPETTKEESI